MSELHIGILNLSSHENYVRNVGEIASEVGSVSIFTTSAIHERATKSSSFGESSSQWELKGDSESERAFLSRVEQRSREDIDVLIAFPFYGHVIDYTTYARFEPHCEYLLYSFDLNGMIGRNPTITREIYNYLKYPLKKAILRRIDRLLVEFSPIAEYVVAEKPSIEVESFTPIVYPDLRDAEGTFENQRIGEPNSITVTIPGMIDSTRRDYAEVLKALGSLPRTQIQQIELVLLGKPIGEYGSTVIESAESLQRDGMELKYFTDWIPTDAFSEWLNTTDILISPLRQRRSIDGFVEYYGRSKGSGAISDAISYGTPLILPAWFDVPERTETGAHTYHDSAHLRSTISELIQNEQMQREWIDGAAKMAQKYTKSLQSQRLQQIVAESRSSSDE